MCKWVTIAMDSASHQFVYVCVSWGGEEKFKNAPRHSILRQPEISVSLHISSFTFQFNCRKEKFKQQIIPGTLHISVSKYVEGIPST